MLDTCSTSEPRTDYVPELTTISIDQLRREITEWDNKLVIIEGKVVYTWYLGFPRGGFYALDDGTGQIPVLKQDITPETGSWVRAIVKPKAMLRMGNTTGIAAIEMEILDSGSFTSNE